jgi:tRNA/tmRNA/rRNA uracil-C5-methylase (TrmA/RlmC/RlmD family)
VPNAAATEVVFEEVGGRRFRVDAGGFWQVHRLAAQSLTELVASELGATGSVDAEAWHLDLYGGVGLFAATLGELGGPATRVTTVESDPRATEHAGENLAEWVGARAETARVDRWIARLEDEASEVQRERLSRGVVLLDPPRSGAGREVVEGLAALGPATVVYVACDPVALARDLATFRTRGYEASRVAALDLFPNSHHIEAVATLTRTPAAR